MILESDVQQTILAFNWRTGYLRAKNRHIEIPTWERRKIKVVNALRKLIREETLKC